MVQETHGLHHFHKRKRIHFKLEKYPSPEKLKGLLDKSIYAVALFGPIMTFPQIYKIWIEKNAAGVSAISWAAYLIGTFFWLFYGIVHKEKPIIFTNIIWGLLQLSIVIGTLIYG